MNKKVTSSLLTVTLSILLTACSNDWCKNHKKAHTEETTTVVAKPANVVLYAFDSSKLTEEGAATSKEYADKIKTMKNAKVIVTGHCSEEGSEAYNNGLGERRANTLAQSLKADGCDCEPAVVSYGKSADFGHGLEHNRRAMIHIGEVAGIPNGHAVSKAAKMHSKKVRKHKAKHHA